MMIDIQVIASEVIMVACHSRAGMPIEHFQNWGGVGAQGSRGDSVVLPSSTNISRKRRAKYRQVQCVCVCVVCVLACVCVRVCVCV